MNNIMLVIDKQMIVSSFKKKKTKVSLNSQRKKEKNKIKKCA